MHAHLLIASMLLACVSLPVALKAQEQPQAVCRERPCGIVVDWTRAGGLGEQTPDKRYGHPGQLEERLKARLSERGYTRHMSSDDGDPRILLIPMIRDAMCDELPGTSTDMSCKAIVELEARVAGPADAVRSIEIPSRLRNRCSSDQVMPVDKLAVFVADWIIYAVDGRTKGERRPVARC